MLQLTFAELLAVNICLLETGIAHIISTGNYRNNGMQSADCNVKKFIYKKPALKAKLTWIQSKRKAAANLQAGYYSDTKRDARKIKKSPWFLYAEEVPLCWAFLNFRLRAQPNTLSSKASNEGMPSTWAFFYIKDFT
jgi:hypothetical protein